MTYSYELEHDGEDYEFTFPSYKAFEAQDIWWDMTSAEVISVYAKRWGYEWGDRDDWNLVEIWEVCEIYGGRWHKAQELKQRRAHERHINFIGLAIEHEDHEQTPTAQNPG